MGGVVVTLVHGTFARHASWTKETSQLSRALKRSGVEVEVFPWSGKNSHHGRRLAGHELSVHLREQAHRRAGYLQVVIAHSHGGNVALYAVKELGLGGIGESIRVITLATPFLHIRKRRLNPVMVASWVNVGLASRLGCLILVPLTGGFPGPNPSARVPLFILLIMFLMHLPSVLKTAFRSGWRFNVNNLPHWIDELVPTWLADLDPPGRATASHSRSSR